MWTICWTEMRGGRPRDFWDRGNREEIIARLIALHKSALTAVEDVLVFPPDSEHDHLALLEEGLE